MRIKTLLLTGFLCTYCFIAANCLAQKVPLSLQAPTGADNDQTALRFKKLLADDIQVSRKFYLWVGKPADLPQNGVRIVVKSIQIKLKDGSQVGSTIVVTADRPSAKDSGYYKLVLEQISWIPKGASVGDETRTFLATLDRALD